MKWLKRTLRVTKGTLLMLCLAVLVLWVRSYWRMDQASHKTASQGPVTSTVDIRFAWSRRGWLCASRFRRWDDQPRTQQEWRKLLEENGWSPGWKARSYGEAEAGPNPPTYSVQDAGWGPIRWDVERFTSKDFRMESGHLRTYHWFLALILGAWPITSLGLAALRARKRRRAARAGHCRQCGYDLRATPERCPECGQSPVQATPDR